MPAIATAVVLLLGLPTPPAADQDAEENLPPHAVVVFPQGRPKAWVTTYELTTGSGACYEVRFNYLDTTDVHPETASLLLAANWVVEVTPFTPMRVYGARTKGGETDRIRSLVLTHRLVDGKGAMPQARPVGKVTVEVKTDNEAARSNRARRTRPTGPELGADSYVEFDLATIPPSNGLEPPNLTFAVYTAAGVDGYSCGVSTTVNPAALREAAEGLLESFTNMGSKAEVVGQTRVRVYGHVWQGRYYPALRGTVDSEDSQPGELPRVAKPRY